MWLTVTPLIESFLSCIWMTGSSRYNKGHSVGYGADNWLTHNTISQAHACFQNGMHSLFWRDLFLCFFLGASQGYQSVTYVLKCICGQMCVRSYIYVTWVWYIFDTYTIYIWYGYRFKSCIGHNYNINIRYVFVYFINTCDRYLYIYVSVCPPQYVLETDNRTAGRGVAKNVSRWLIMYPCEIYVAFITALFY